MDNETKLLQELSSFVATTAPERRAAAIRALEASLNLLNARVSLPHAATWFLENWTADEKPASEDVWASRVGPEAAAELRELVPRFVVLYGESQRCSLVGNSGAAWAYSALALLPAPPDETLQDRLLIELFEDVASRNSACEFQSDQICSRAYRCAPPDALLRIHYEYEDPDFRMGHSMMRLEIDLDDVVSFWPALDDAEYNFVDRETLSEICDRLGLRRVLPLQLAAFLTVAAAATADHTESWGGEQGASFFHDGNIPYLMKRLEADE
jgi:hypothetical protein